MGNKIKTSHWKFNENKKITNIQDIQLNLKINAIVKQYLNNQISKVGFPTIKDNKLYSILKIKNQQLRTS